MPQTLNNEDIRGGLFSDHEVRVWVNCNYVMMVLEEGSDEALKEQVGCFQYLPNEHQEWFWKEFNRYFANNAKGDAMKFMNEFETSEHGHIGLYECLSDCWDASFDELEEHWFSDGRETLWLLAVEEWKTENKSE